MKNITLIFASLLFISCSHIKSTKEVKTSAQKEAIHNKMAEKQAELTQCYGEKVIEANKEEAANLLVSWHIDEAGKAIDAEVLESSTKNKDFGNCILKTLETVKFEKPEKAHATIKMPFIFTAN